MRRLCVACVTLLGCSSDPLESALPKLPPTGGPAAASAGRITADNFAQERVTGPASQGLAGDYFMRNDKVRIVVQAPGRAMGPCPYGGNPIDFDRVDSPAGDQLGEVSAFMQLGRTFNWDKAEIVRDGTQGGPAVLRFYGTDAKDDFINIRGLGSFALAIPDNLTADVVLNLRGAVTYILMPGETKLRMIYTFYNPNDKDLATMWGTLSDTGAGPEIFHEYSGFGELQISDIIGAQKAPSVHYVALQGRGSAIGIAPVFDDKTIGGQSVPVAGVDVEAYGLTTLADAFGDAGSTLQIAAGKTDSREVDLMIGRDAGDVTAQVRAIRGEATVAFSGSVTNGAGARIAVLDPSKPANQQLQTTLTADANGAFAGALPAGTYSLQAEGDNWRRGDVVMATIPGGDIALAVPAAALLSYTVKDRAGAPSPAKISVIGAPAAAPDKKFRDVTTDTLPFGLAAWQHSRKGDSSANDRWDHPIALVPGHYRVVFSRGPEWDRFEQVIDLPASGMQLDAVLDQVAPTPGYVAADFHQHSHISPDAIAPPEDRVVSYLADGAEFISSSEHDVLFDYAPLIAELGVQDLLASDIGVETTCWDYGHYIGFPLNLDPNSPNGGAFDWGGGASGMPNKPPPVIFDGLRSIGAQVVQVNHPRALASDFSNFQQSFDRVGLRFDFNARTFYGDKSLMPIEALVLGLDPNAPMFAPTFDAHEIFNGHHLPSMPADGERIDERVDLNLRDWMNFLSFGFTPTPTGVSDSHEWVQSPGGLPRTLVRVGDDSSAAIAHGLTDQIVQSISGKGAPHDVVVTTGPFIQFTADGAGIGSTVAHASGPIAIHIQVTAATWEPVDTVEVFANNTFDIPLPKGAMAEPLNPVLCFTTRASPSARCAQAVGGAQPLAGAQLKTVQITAGVPYATRQEITIDATLDPAAVAQRARAGAQGSDLWLVVRATGETGMFPTIPGLIAPSTPLTQLIDTPDYTGIGVPALAFTNAIFVDVDGGGWRGPFQP
jgi:hypothetical protein